MIIQCKQCRTKFRFDESQMEGDGLWMRCSRCQHVFFQDNLSKINAPGVRPQAPPVFAQETPPQKTNGRLSFEPAGVVPGPPTPDEDVKSFLQDVMASEKTGREELKAEPQPPEKAGMDLADIEFSPASENLDETEESWDVIDEDQAPPPVRKKSKVWKVTLWAWAILVIIIIPVIICFYIVPDVGERYVQIVRKYVGLAQPMQGQSVTGQVKLQDIRQRVINNYILGNIRIVEGTAVNQADFSIARILVKAQILDAYEVVLGERLSYAGNILTDEDLASLSEEEIFKRLSWPEGRDNSNERLIPNGRIPFMIVFTRELQGTLKTTVIVAGAERLL